MEDFERFTVKAQDSKNPNEGYHTDDLEDAIGTAKAQAAHMGVAFKIIDNRRKRNAGVAQPDGTFGHSASSVLAKKPPGIVSIDKGQLREMIRAAVIKRLEEGKTKPPASRNLKEEIESKRKQIAEVKARLQKEGMTPHGSRLGKQKGVGGEAMGGGVPGAMGAIDEGPKPDLYTAEKLLSFIQKSHEFMGGHVKKAIERLIARQMESGQYNSAQAPALWMHLVDAAAKAYIEHFAPGNGMIDQVFPIEVRKEAAMSLAKDFEKRVQADGTLIKKSINNFFEAKKGGKR